MGLRGHLLHLLTVIKVTGVTELRRMVGNEG